MKLYFAPGACSLSPHIVSREAGIELDLERVDLKTHKLADGSDYYGINPNGYVPLLVLDDGTQLTEGPAIVQYLADRAPDKQLAPPNGTVERYKLQSLLNFISTEIHKSFSPLFSPAVPEDYKTMARDKLAQRFTTTEQRLGDQRYLTGDRFSVADAYLYTVLSWSKPLGIDLGRWPKLAAYHARIDERPAVVAARKAEATG
jgi:glutathione S-transferase